jgi:hypothetical protein
VFIRYVNNNIHIYYIYILIEKIEMGGACSTYGERERYVQGSGEET